MAFFIFLVLPIPKPNSMSTRRHNVPFHSNFRVVSVRHAAGGIVRSTLLLMEGTEKQEKLCCRCRTGVVLVATATGSSVGHMSGCIFFVLDLAEFRVGEPGNTQQHRVSVQRVQGLDRQA